jgi:site-specific recombinase XerD
MALKLYRRHRKECEAGYPEDTRSGEFEEHRRGWKRCGCPVHVSGSIAGKFKRQSTGQWEWNAAREVVAQWESAGAWAIPAVVPPSMPVETPAEPGVPAIKEATDAFLAKCQNRGIRRTTFAKYRTFVRQLNAYAETRGYMRTNQLTVVDMDRFYASWSDGIRSRAKKLERLKSFVRFCKKRNWIAEDITEDLEAPQGASVNVPKAPFTDEELGRIFSACDIIGAPTKPGPGYRTWSGEDAKDFIYLSIYTGLRISDVATFDATKRLQGNNVFLRMHKTAKPLSTWIPDWLVDRLRSREERNGALIFRCGVSFTTKQLCDIWRNVRLKKVFSLAGPFEEKPTPHRFRHTFARILLEKGVSVADVAELIGDTERMVTLHYSKWIQTRQDRLSRILQHAFTDKPKPKVVAMSGRRL